jgi:hypothetical protein
MRILAASLGYAVTAGFFVLAIKAVEDLRVRRDRRDAYLACAIVRLTVVALSSQVQLAYPPIAAVGSKVAVVGLMASAYALSSSVARSSRFIAWIELPAAEPPQPAPSDIPKPDELVAVRASK